jgi:hypothetical protein
VIAKRKGEITLAARRGLKEAWSKDASRYKNWIARSVRKEREKIGKLPLAASNPVLLRDAAALMRKSQNARS